MEYTLKRNGYSVISAECGSSAVESVSKHKDEIELVLTDVVLPLFTGPEVADKILRERPHVEIMFMTGFSPDEILPPRYKKRFNALMKPFTPSQLVAAVRDCLKHCD